MSKDILNIIYESFDQIVSEHSYVEKIEKNEQTIIYGRLSLFDSLGLANFLLVVERNIFLEYSLDICMVDEAAKAKGKNPFLTLGSLAEFVEGLIKKSKKS